MSYSLRYALVYPLTLIAVGLYGNYTVPREWMKKLFGEGSILYYLALLLLLPSGLVAGVTNLVYNLLVGSFVFFEGPQWTNEEGKFSPLFTTRINKYLSEEPSTSDKYKVALSYAVLVNRVDPDHFKL